MTDYVESIYSKLKPHKKRLKEFKYNNLDKIKQKYDTVYKSTNDEIIGLCFKELNKDYTKNEIRYYLRFIFDSLFSEASDFKKRLKEKDILVYLNGFDKYFINKNYYHFNFIATVKDKKKFEKELIKELKNKVYNERDFNLFVRSLIGSEALKIDNKYQTFYNFVIAKEYNDNFDDIEFLKKLKFERFLEFYKTLNFDDYVVGIVSDIER